MFPPYWVPQNGRTGDQMGHDADRAEMPSFIEIDLAKRNPNYQRVILFLLSILRLSIQKVQVSQNYTALQYVLGLSLIIFIDNM